jgi:hypothetical protein
VDDQAVLLYYMIEGDERMGDMCNAVWKEEGSEVERREREGGCG